MEYDDVTPLPKNVIAGLFPADAAERQLFDQTLDGMVVACAHAELEAGLRSQRAHLQRVFAFPQHFSRADWVLKYLSQRFSWLFAMDDAFLRYQAMQYFFIDHEEERIIDGWNKSLYALVMAHDIHPEKELDGLGEGLNLVNPKVLDEEHQAHMEAFEQALSDISDRPRFEKAKTDFERTRVLKQNPANRSPETYQVLSRVRKGELFGNPSHPVLEEVLAEEAPFRALLQMTLEQTRVMLRTLMKIRVHMPAPGVFSELMVVFPDALPIANRMGFAMQLSALLEPCFILDPRHEERSAFHIATSTPAGDPVQLQMVVRNLLAERGVDLQAEQVFVQQSPVEG